MKILTILFLALFFIPDAFADVSTPQIEILNEHIYEEDALWTNTSSLYGLTYNFKSPIGLYFATRHDDRLGWYFDLAISAGPPEGSRMNISKYMAEDVFHDTRKGKKYQYTTINVGRTLKVNEVMTTFLSLGFGSGREFQEYQDKTGILGSRGQYFIENDNSAGVNFQGGIFIIPSPKKSSLHFYFSLSSFLQSATIGVGL